MKNLILVFSLILHSFSHSKARNIDLLFSCPLKQGSLVGTFHVDLYANANIHLKNKSSSIGKSLDSSKKLNCPIKINSVRKMRSSFINLSALKLGLKISQDCIANMVSSNQIKISKQLYEYPKLLMFKKSKNTWNVKLEWKKNSGYQDCGIHEIKDNDFKTMLNKI